MTASFYIFLKPFIEPQKGVWHFGFGSTVKSAINILQEVSSQGF